MAKQDSMAVLYGLLVTRMIETLANGKDVSAPFLNVVRQFLKDNNISSAVFKEAVEQHSDELQEFLESGKLSDEVKDKLLETMGTIGSA